MGSKAAMVSDPLAAFGPTGSDTVAAFEPMGTDPVADGVIQWL